MDSVMSVNEVSFLIIINIIMEFSFCNSMTMLALG
jgi:hypothetical protein